MKKLLLVAILVLAAFVSGAYLSGHEKVRLGGSGELISPMQELAKVYQAKNRSDRVEVIADNLGSTGGIRATQEGHVAIGLTARSLRDDEKASLHYRAIGRMPIVVAVQREMPVGNLTESQLCDIFAGRITSWRGLGGGSDEKILVVTRREEDGIKLAIRDRLGCFRKLQESPAALVPTNERVLGETLSRRPSAIGLATLGFVLGSQGRVKALALNGVVPSAESVRNGSYPLFQEIGVVTRGVPSGLTHRFLEFVETPEGARVLDHQGVVLTAAI